jgi:two-component system response regulator HydG
MKALEDYSWPGNVRQLRNVVEKMVVLSPGGRLTIDDVPVEILGDACAAPTCAPTAPEAKPEAEAAGEPGGRLYAKPPKAATLAATEKETVLAALADCRNNKSKAALQLGISRRTLHRKLNEWGVR